jgi:hypothetical protein
MAGCTVCVNTPISGPSNKDKTGTEASISPKTLLQNGTCHVGCDILQSHSTSLAQAQLPAELKWLEAVDMSICRHPPPSKVKAVGCGVVQAPLGGLPPGWPHSAQSVCGACLGCMTGPSFQAVCLVMCCNPGSGIVTDHCCLEGLLLVSQLSCVWHAHCADCLVLAVADILAL